MDCFEVGVRYVERLLCHYELRFQPVHAIYCHASQLRCMRCFFSTPAPAVHSLMMACLECNVLHWSPCGNDDAQSLN